MDPVLLLLLMIAAGFIVPLVVYRRRRSGGTTSIDRALATQDRAEAEGLAYLNTVRWGAGPPP